MGSNMDPCRSPFCFSNGHTAAYCPVFDAGPYWGFHTIPNPAARYTFAGSLADPGPAQDDAHGVVQQRGAVLPAGRDEVVVAVRPDDYGRKPPPAPAPALPHLNFCQYGACPAIATICGKLFDAYEHEDSHRHFCKIHSKVVRQLHRSCHTVRMVDISSCFSDSKTDEKTLDKLL